VRKRDHALAAGVALHLLFVVITGIGHAPTFESKSDRNALAHASVGNDAVAERMASVGAGWNRFRDGVADLTHPYARYCGTYQTWRMFAGTQRHSLRIEVAVRVEGGWEALWIEGLNPDPVARHYRFRHLSRHLKRSSKNRLWDRYAKSVGARALLAVPAADEVRVRVMRARIPRPGEGSGLLFDHEVKASVVRR
jgi:hypothetical protein